MFVTPPCCVYCGLTTDALPLLPIRVAVRIAELMYQDRNRFYVLQLEE